MTCILPAPTTTVHTSDVAHIISLIDCEIQAMNNAAKFAAVTRHKIISHGYHRIGYHLASFPQEVTPQERAAIFFERCESLVL